MYYYLQWHKSTWMKSMITKESLNGSKKHTETNMIPKLKLNIPLFLNKIKSKQEKNIDLNDEIPVNKKLDFNNI